MKKLLSVVLCFVLVASCFVGCSKTNNELTEENITATVEAINESLKRFDTDKLEKYIDSRVLSIIVKYAEKHQQFAELGKAIFSSLNLEVESIDLEANTVTISAQNKNLYSIAESFAEKLKSEYSTFDLLQKLSDDAFLDEKLAELTAEIDAAEMQSEKSIITLEIRQGSDSLIMTFDTDDENIVSGGALGAIMGIYG